MPEIKNQFTGGRMNKDLDERLIPKGEYRDAMNIQVTTSEGSDVGAVQNILGNVPGCTYINPNDNPIVSGSSAVGSISDEKNDSLYWFIAGPKNQSNLPLPPNQSTSFKDIIMRSTGSNSGAAVCEPVFVDKFKYCLGVQPQTSLSILNSITLSNTSLYSNVTVGMYATGFNGSTQAFGPTLITSVGTLNTVPVNYQSGFTSTSSFPVVHNTTFTLLFWDNNGNPSGTFLQKETNVIYLNQYFGNNPSDLIGNTFVLDTFTTPQNFTISTAIFSNDFDDDGNLIGYIKITLDTNITCFSLLNNCAINGFAPLSPYNADLADHAVASSLANGNPITGTITSNTPVVSYTPNNIIYIPPSYSQWLDEIYRTLWDDTSGVPVSTGAQLLINSTNFPPNSCIDPASVIDPAGGFLVGPPIVFNNSFGVIDCDSGNSVNALRANTLNRPITLTTQNGVSAIFLNNSVNFQDVDTICFESDKVLNFDPNRLITGVNIVDDMLFWTDNFSEPKKINIARGISGTDTAGDTHTAVVNSEAGLNLLNYTPIKEEHITVIKKAPKSSLNMELESSRDPDKNYSGIVTISDDSNLPLTSMWSNWLLNSNSLTPQTTNPYDFSAVTTEEGSNIIRFVILTDLDTNPTFNLDDWKIGAKVVLKEFDNGVAPQTPITDYTIKGHVTDWNWTNNLGEIQDVNSFTSSSVNGVKVAIKVTSIARPPLTATGSLNYGIDLFDEVEKLYEFKLPRFSYRYKYEDGEYSTFAPFTSVAFKPSSFDYHPKKGYNLGMTNNIKKVHLKGFVTEDIPLDVTGIDILYKEDSSPNVYIVETIHPTSEATISNAFGVQFNNWQLNKFTIENENIKGVLPSNQLLRPWDNVPKKALAQEITGSRIVYGNYEQNYDLTTNGYRYSPKFSSDLISDSSNIKSIKSLREYQLGVVFADKYGRETPVISNNTGTFKVEKSEGIKANKLQVSLNSSSAPQNVTNFKFYIKETSGEYYNMAMDRYWDAEDGNIWVSFASSDRNKIDEDSFLILKKGVDSNDLIEDPARFKVIAIENEAPDFIKINKTVISDVEHQFTTITQNIFIQNSTELPTSGSKFFSLRYDTGTTPIYSNTSIKNLYRADGIAPNEEIYFQLLSQDGAKSSVPMRIAKIDIDGELDPITNTFLVATNFVIVLEKAFGDDINKFTNDPQGNNVDYIVDGTRAIFWSYKKENSPEFDGRFFVKIFEEEVFTQYIVNNPTAASQSNNYSSVLSQKIYSFNASSHDKAWNSASGNIHSTGTAVSLENTQPVFGAAQWQDYIQATDNNGFQQGVSNNNWKSHAAFFRGLNIVKAQGGTSNGQQLFQHGINKRQATDTMDLHSPVNPSNASWVQFEDVWFIDGETSTGFHTGEWGGPHNSNDHSGVGLDLTATTTGHIEIGFGGIQPGDPFKTGNAWPWNVNTQILGGVISQDDDFYNLEKNNHYNSNANNLAQYFKNGTVFSWKEDPTNQVFIVRGQEVWQLLRHEEDLRRAGGSPLGTEKAVQQATAREEAYGISPSFVPGFLPTLTNEINNVTYHQSTFYRPDNYSVNYRFKFNDVGDAAKSIDWDPYTPGPIANGLEIPITVTAVGANNEITVSSLTGTDLNPAYGDQTISVGMVWDTSTVPSNQNWTAGSVNQGAVISEINGLVLKFKNYDGTSPDNVFPTLTATTGSPQIIHVRQFGMNGISRNSAKNINYFNDGEGFAAANNGVDAVGYTIDIKDNSSGSFESIFPRFPAVFETEPKENNALDIYYEITDSIPTYLNSENISSILPIGSVIEIKAVDSSVGTNGFISSTDNITILSNTYNGSGNEIIVSSNLGGFNIVFGDKLLVTKPNGDIFEFEIKEMTATTTPLSVFKLNRNILQQKITSNWHNCFSFGNGVESNRIRDNFNLPFMSNGVKVSTTLDQEYKKENRKYGLIYSGLYNSTSGLNNLNQFLQAEKITKDLNPTYGSIQKLHAGWGQSGDLLALCEDRVLKILANKDSLFNADGDTNVTSTNNVLGTALPYSGEYGISKNPESFASEAYRAYFTDKVRGSVMRLSMDGITPISGHGMKDYFKDNLKKSNKLIGSYDDKKDEYNLTLKDIEKTVTFKENSKGWVSFKSFFPENAISCANEYYTFKDGNLWRHHEQSQDRNTFYHVLGSTTSFTPSSVNVILNDSPNSIKTFHTLNYEGSQSKIIAFTNYNTFVPGTNVVSGNVFNNEYYNLQDKKGWYVENVITDQDQGSLSEFIEKEGKWFNYIKGV